MLEVFRCLFPLFGKSPKGESKTRESTRFSDSWIISKEKWKGSGVANSEEDGVMVPLSFLYLPRYSSVVYARAVREKSTSVQA
jgi:hypothetical protein